MDDARHPPLRIAVLISGQGRGSNFGAILSACAGGEIRGEVALVLGTRTDSPAMDRARAASVPVCVVSPRKYEGDDSGYSAALLRALGRAHVELICLAGYMRKLPIEVIRQYPGRVMNIHNALLPLFGGQGMFGEHVHRAVLESGMKLSGCTVHFVNEQYDAGPIIIQACVPVLDNDTTETLAARVLIEEHRSYVRAVKLFAEGKLKLSDDGRFVIGAYPEDYPCGK